MSGIPALLLGVPEERGEIDDPQDVVQAGRDQIEAAPKLHP